MAEVAAVVIRIVSSPAVKVIGEFDAGSSISKLLYRIKHVGNIVCQLEMRLATERSVTAQNLEDLRWIKLKHVLDEITTVGEEWDIAVKGHEDWMKREAGPICFPICGLCGKASKQKQMNWFFKCCFCCLEGCHGTLRYTVRSRVKKMNKVIDRVYDELKLIVEGNATSGPSFASRTTTPIENLSWVKGRVGEAEEVVNLLLNEDLEGDNVQAVCLTGLGGIGKSTLAKVVYQNNRVKEYFHGNTGWLHVSVPFDKLSIAKTLLRILSGGEEKDYDSLEVIYFKIRHLTHQRRFLLVVDDVWEESADCKQWQEIIEALKCGSSGSRILLTTRSLTVATQALGFKRPRIYKLPKLPPGDCLLIFQDSTISDWSGSDNLYIETIRKIIWDVCHGLPFIAEDLSLCFMEFSGGGNINVLSSQFWIAYKQTDKRFRHLKLSYDSLSLVQRRCLEFCGSLPHNSWLEKEELIKLWVTEDLLVVPTSTLAANQDFDILAGQILSSLVSCSFFETREKSTGTEFQIHPVVRDFAQTVGQNRSIYFDLTAPGSMSNMIMSSEPRCLRLLLASNSLKILDEMNKVRSLVIELRNTVLTEATLAKLFKSATWLRSLGLRGCGITSISAKVKRLIHLRWLNLSHNPDLSRLPEELCELFYLEALWVDGCRSLVTLPSSMQKLINLKSFRNRDTNACIPTSLFSLPLLTTLSMFKIGAAVQDGMATLTDLMKYANKLSGFFSITGLNHVRQPMLDEFRLDAFEQIESLELVFDHATPLVAAVQGNVEDETRVSTELAVLSALKPPPGIDALTIVGYYGSSAPIWLNDSLVFKTLKISRCPNWVELPGLGSLEYLEELELEEMASVTAVNSGIFGSSWPESVAFPRLTQLRFKSMSRWANWCEGLEVVDRRMIMPRLQSVCIIDCPMLGAIPQGLRDLSDAGRLVIKVED